MDSVRKIKQTILTLTVVGLVAIFGCTQTSSQDGTAAAVATTPYTGCYGLGCATGVPTPIPTAVPTGPGGNVSNPAVPTPTPLTTGSTGVLTITNQAAFNTYVGAALNNPSNVQINLSLSPTTDTPQVFLGTMDIRYNDSQPSGALILHDGHFTNGSTSQNGNNVSIMTTNSSGGQVYRIFMEDIAGALVVVLSTTSSGGSDTGSSGSGQVYFMNFDTTAPNPLFDSYYEQTSYCAYGYDPNCILYGGFYYNYYPANPNAYCWAGIITAGPYDCRNFSVPPTGGSKIYTMLGTISNLDINTALGI